MVTRMKLSSLAVSMALLLAFGAGAFASEQSTANDSQQLLASIKKQKQKPATTTTEKDKPIQVTGSYIPRKVKKSGLITDTPSPLYVIDSKTIRNSGASDLRQLLTRQGTNH